MSPIVSDWSFATSSTCENIQKIISPTNGEHRRWRREKQKKLFSGTVGDGKNNMADQNERDEHEARLAVIAKQAISSDINFVELIREFPTLYNKKVKIFKVKGKKKTAERQ